MVYIYKKNIGKNDYYYLRASIKKEKKIITKDIAYLGNNIPSVKKNLSKLKEYQGDIRKAYKTINKFIESNFYLEKIRKKKLKKDGYLKKEALENVEAVNYHYKSIFLKNDEKTKEEIFKNFIIEFSFNTSSIEGNTITLDEARRLLTENLTPKNKTLREIHDVKNTEKVFFEVLSRKTEIKHKFIIDIHKNLLKEIDTRTGYRTQDVRVLKMNFKATPAPYVKTDIDLLLKWHKNNKKHLHPFVLAIIFHHKFEKIHPFMDGNGRTGRMLANQILINTGLPPLIIRKKNRKEYLALLNKADKSELEKADSNIYSKLIEFAANEYIENYWNIFL